MNVTTENIAVRMPVELKIEDVRAKAAEIVKAVGPNFLYTNMSGETPSEDTLVSCYYMHGPEKPGCVVGRILFELGVNASDLHAYEGNRAYSMVAGLIGDNRVTVDTEDISSYLQDMQIVQDGGGTWAKAFEQAEINMQ